MNEPDGLLGRLRGGGLTPLDLEYVKYKIGMAADRTELKLLRHLQERIIAEMNRNGRVDR